MPGKECPAAQSAWRLTRHSVSPVVEHGVAPSRHSALRALRPSQVSSPQVVLAFALPGRHIVLLLQVRATGSRVAKNI